MDPRFLQTLLAANNPTNLGGSPLGNGADIQNLQNLAQLQFKAGAAAPAIAAAGGAAKSKAAEEAAAAEAARQQQIASVKQKISDNADLADDPKNYKAQINDKGGYTFYDPSGKEIIAAQYAKATNQRLTDVFKDSQDPHQQDFSKTYKQVAAYGKALATGDKKTAEKLFESDPAFGQFARGKTFKQVVDAFHQGYGDYLRPQQADAIKQDAQNGGSLDKMGMAAPTPGRGMLGDFINGITGGNQPSKGALLQENDPAISKSYKGILDEEARKRRQQQQGGGIGGFLKGILNFG